MKTHISWLADTHTLVCEHTYLARSRTYEFRRTSHLSSLPLHTSSRVSICTFVLVRKSHLSSLSPPHLLKGQYLYSCTGKASSLSNLGRLQNAERSVHGGDQRMLTYAYVC
jgi:hypothetical protein